MLLDASQRVEYASPNAVSALHRVGVQGNAVGMRLGELGFDDHTVRLAFESGAPATEEFEQAARGRGARALPPVAQRPQGRAGASCSSRDISELRRRDRHAAQQGRDDPRDPSSGEEQPADDLVAAAPAGSPARRRPEAKAAVEESVRRIRTIALVHETLSRDVGDDIDFKEILLPLAAMVEEGLAVARPSRALRRSKATPAACRRASRRRSRSCSPSCSRTRSSTRSVDGRPGHDLGGDGQRRVRARGEGHATTASGCPKGSASKTRPGSACRSCGRW